MAMDSLVGILHDRTATIADKTSGASEGGPLEQCPLGDRLPGVDSKPKASSRGVYTI